MRSPLDPSQVMKMLETEIIAVKKFFASCARQPNVRLRLPLNQFVSRNFLLHRNLITRWGGWSFQGPEIMVTDPEFAQGIAMQEFQAFGRAVANAVREKEIPAEWQGVLHGFVLPGAYNNINAGAILSNKNFQPSYDIGSRTEKTMSETKLPILLRMRPATPEERMKYGNSRMQEYVYAAIRHEQRISSAAMRGLEEAKAPKRLMEEYEKLFQRLGEQAWGSSAYPITCTLSCAPSAFLKLGEYGENSCYQNAGGHEYSKYFLGCDVADSFVALFRRGKPNEEEGEKKSPVNGRAWGIACPKRGAIVSNFYLLSKNMVLPCLKETLAAGLDMPELKELPINGTWQARLQESLYLNSDTTVLGRKSLIKQRLMEHFLTEVVVQAYHYGFYGMHGQGPSFIRMHTNAWDIIGPTKSKARYRALWPYKDARLKDLLAKSISEDGTFSPLKGPVYEAENDEEF